MKIKSSDGTQLYVVDSGEIERPSILFIHGWKQGHVIWEHQMQSALLKSKYRMVSFDLRGHGFSDKSTEPSRYTDASLWADDIHCVIEECGLKEPIVCAWSSGAIFLGDYIQKYGTELIKGIMLTSPITKAYSKAKFMKITLDYNFSSLSSDKSIERIAANQKFVQFLTYKNQDPKLYYLLLGTNLTVSDEASLAVYSRENYSCIEALNKINIPALVIHGKQDVFVSAEETEEDAKRMGAKFISYDNCGHSPFLEESERFNTDLHRFAMKTNLLNSKPSTSLFHLLKPHVSPATYNSTMDLNDLKFALRKSF